MGYRGLDALFELISPVFRCQNVRTVITMDVAPIWTQEPQPMFPALSHADSQPSAAAYNLT